MTRSECFNFTIHIIDILLQNFRGNRALHRFATGINYKTELTWKYSTSKFLRNRFSFFCYNI